MIFNALDTRSFSSLWYWIVLWLVWFLVGRRILGVPSGVLLSAEKQGGDTLARVETLLRLHAGHTVANADNTGPWSIMLRTFLCTTLALLGLVYGMELARALMFILLPLDFLWAMELRQARLILARDESGVDMIRRLRGHYFRVQLLGGVAMIVTMLFGLWSNLQSGLLH